MKILHEMSIDIDDNFVFDENGQKVSKRVENVVGNGEIACYEQYLFFPKCFQKTCTTDTKKEKLLWEKVKDILTLVLQNFQHSILKITELSSMTEVGVTSKFRKILENKD